MSSPAASAAGQSSSTNNCYVKWWNTAWVEQCDGASAPGLYRAQIVYNYETDYSGPWRYIYSGSWGQFDSGEATFGVGGGWVEYTG